MASRAARNQQPKRAEARHGQGTTPLEWIIAGAGALLLAAVLGYLTHFALTQHEAAPAPRVEALSTTPAANGYLVRYRVTNDANGTAAGLQVLGELRHGERTLEQREAVIDYLPPYSSRDGGFYFRQNPADHDLVLSVGGYSEP